MAKIAMLHTSLVFLTVDTGIQQLIAELSPQDEVVHLVDSDVLATVIRDGSITDDSRSRIRHLAEAAEAAGADVIFSACSSLGPAVDAAKEHVTTPIVKIDDAMAALAAGSAERIGVLATVPSTLPPTSALIRAAAGSCERDVAVVERLCEGAFDVLMGGDREGHDAMVLEAARALAPEVEVVVLAQASMARLAPSLEEALGVPVLSSPRAGVEDLVAVAHAGAPVG